MTSRRRIKHRDWVISAAKSISGTVALYDRYSVPPPLEVWMVVVPTQRLLRGIYGSDLKAALMLLWMALGSERKQWLQNVKFFWRYRILMKSPDGDYNKMLGEMGIAGENQEECDANENE